MPFDCLVVFSTNLDPAALADEAFLRRIRYKIEVADPSEAAFKEIFRRECERAGVACERDGRSSTCSPTHYRTPSRPCAPASRATSWITSSTRSATPGRCRP